MNVLGPIRCLFSPHQVNRRRVRNEGDIFTGYCFHCGAPIRRITRDKWVRDWRATFHMTPAPPLPLEDQRPPAPTRKKRRQSDPKR